jgi:hypothetical protein
VSSRFLSLLLAAPLVVAGTEGAHWLAFRLVTPDAHARAHQLQETGHGYLAHAIPLLALLAFLFAAGALLRVAAAARGSTQARFGILPFAVVPPLAFLLQEAIERLSQGEAMTALLAEPVVLIGLAAQLPVAVLTWILARCVTRGADTLGAVLGRMATPRAPRLECAAPVWIDILPPRVPALALNRAGRAPPVATAA